MLRVTSIAIASVLFVGCASVPTESPEKEKQAKQFSQPADGQSSLYIYRSNSGVGGALKKDIWVDGKCVGETAPGVFFYEQVTANADHTISTESEFSPNNLVIHTEPGKSYFVQQYIKMGAFSGGADVKKVDEVEGKKQVANLKLAKGGTCSK